MSLTDAAAAGHVTLTMTSRAMTSLPMTSRPLTRWRYVASCCVQQPTDDDDLGQRFVGQGHQCQGH